MMWWAWLLWFLLFLLGFALLERYAFRHPDRQWTLSRTVANLGAAFPLSIGFFGLIVGGLMVHFFWHFCP